MDIYFWDAGVLSVVYQRVPFISDPRVEFESTCSEELAVIRSVDVPVMIVM
jgi:hypothetical protein